MSKQLKNQSEILEKLNIEALNSMQIAFGDAFNKNKNLVLLSPTGTGKTVAFLLPIIHNIDASLDFVQCIIIVPTRELAIQIEQVIRDMGAGLKAHSFYGGQTFSTDLNNLIQPPSIIVATPGRLADHLRRKTFETKHVETLVLDEFDKSLEIGFEDEMKEILNVLNFVDYKVLTSATQGLEIPDFVNLSQPKILDFLHEKTNKLQVKIVVTPEKNKLQSLSKLLNELHGQSGIIFCNFKDTINWLSEYLSHQNIKHGVFYGGLDQRDRERALIKFRNGTHRIIIATDLAARGIDVPALNFIIHFQLPLKGEEFTHRNGRTARMHQEGTAFVLKYYKEQLPDFIAKTNPKKHVVKEVGNTNKSSQQEWTTVFVSGGRKDKISKGDIAGFFIKQGSLKQEDIGIIELKKDCAFVAVNATKLNLLLPKVNNVKLKKKKVRVSEI